MTGTYEHNVDTKGRLFIPACLREELGESFYLSVGTDNYVAMYPQSMWDTIQDKFKGLSMENSDTMKVLFANTRKVELDSQGRIVIPPFLREFAGLTREIVILGLPNRAEIWAAETWAEKHQTAETITPAQVKAMMAALGL